MAQTAGRTFASPFEIEPPPGADDWQRLYPYYYLFSDDRREHEEEKFWFFDGMHNPEPVYPFDTIMPESWWVFLNQYLTRVWMLPTVLGIDHRMVNGYLYVSPTTIDDPQVVEQRLEQFLDRAGFYYQNWDEIYDKWIAKAEDCIERLKAITFEPLGEMEPRSMVTEARGLTTGFDLLASYSRLLENMHEMANYHFELNMLGYGAFLSFSDLCKNSFPGIPDQTIARMVGGVDILFFRPDDELRKLARLAVEQDLAGIVESTRDPAAMLAQIEQAPGGRRWLEAFEEAKDPWFWFSSGPGYCHQHRAWIDDLGLPFDAMRGYVQKLRDGESIERPLEQLVRERDRISSEYRDLLATEEERASFQEMLDLARKVYVFVENHNFYCEHWHHSIFWNKVRELGRVFVAGGFFGDEEDVFMLHRYELYEALYDLLSAWATGNPGRPQHWQREIAERKRIMAALRGWAPPPALGKPPKEITEAATVMLWGITSDMVEQWLDAEDPSAEGTDGELRGFAASPGVAEGPARVITAVDQLNQVQKGDILVCPITAPSWAPVFNLIEGAVSDIGGIMSHAAIVSREYGLPAVVGTGFGTKTIRTGQRVRVDGGSGVVTVID